MDIATNKAKLPKECWGGWIYHKKKPKYKRMHEKLKIFRLESKKDIDILT